MERSKTCGNSARAMPVPVSLTASVTGRRAHRSRTTISAFERELEGVRDEIHHDLLPHLAIDVDGLRERRAIDDEAQPGPLDRRAEHAGKIGGERGEVGRLVVGLHAAGLDAREVEQSVHQLQQPQPVAMRPRSAPRVARRQSALGPREQRPRSDRASTSAGCGTRGSRSRRTRSSRDRARRARRPGAVRLRRRSRWRGWSRSGRPPDRRTRDTRHRAGGMG